MSERSVTGWPTRMSPADLLEPIGEVYGAVTFGVNLRQIDADIRDSTFCPTQLDRCIESGLEPPMCDGTYL